MEDLEVVTERLRSAEEAHGKEVDEQQRRSNDLQERLVETRAHKEQVWWLSEEEGVVACSPLVASVVRAAAVAAVAMATVLGFTVVLCVFVGSGVIFWLV